MNFNPNVNDLAGEATLIGSFPFKDHAETVDLVLKYVPRIPCWPQLPAYPQEGMLRQFSSGLPGFDPEKLVLDPQTPGFEEEKLRFYEEYLAVTEGEGSLEGTRFCLSPEDARGFFVFLEKASAKAPFPAVKGQITGPFTLSVGIKTPEGKAVFYDPEGRDMVVKLVALKARFQVEKLKSLSERVIIFFDEPALSGFGSSAFVGVSKEEVLGMLNEVAGEVRQAGGLAGIHICGNTDWTLPVEAQLDLINFDAYDFWERFVSYGKEIRGFLERGGVIAWGLVPTLKADRLVAETPQTLRQRFEELLKRLSETSGLSKDVLKKHSLFTPSCGMGTLSPELTLKALELLRSLTS